MMLKRESEIVLSAAINSGKVALVLGARQVGKTTLVESFFSGQDVRFLNFDVELHKQQFIAASRMAPLEALRTLGNPKILVLDEAQRLPEACRIVKGWFDSRVPTSFVLLGSSALNLLDQSAESLTGRNRKVLLPPLTWSETLGATEWGASVTTQPEARGALSQAIRAFLMQRLALGSYPEAVLASEPKAVLRNLCADYLWKDILQEGLVRNPTLLRRLLMLLAHQIGSEVSISELATQLQMHRNTVMRHLDLLEQTFVIFRLPAFSTNPRKEICKSQKIYFWDTGIRNALLNAFSAHEWRTDIGVLWENWAIAEVAKRNMIMGSPWELFFWRSRSKSEVDLVLTHEHGLHAFEFKWKATSKARSLRAFEEAYGSSVEVVSASDPFFVSGFLGT